MWGRRSPLRAWPWAKIPLRPVCRHVPSWGCGLQGKRTKPCAPTAGYPLPAPSFPVGEVDSASPRLAEERRLRAAAARAPPVAGAASRAFLRPQAGPVREGLWLPRKPWTGPGSEENQGGVERASWGGGRACLPELEMKPKKTRCCLGSVQGAAACQQPGSLDGLPEAQSAQCGARRPSSLASPRARMNGPLTGQL